MCKAGTNADYPDFHVPVQALSFSTPHMKPAHMKLHLYVAKSEVLQSSSSSSSSLVLDKILIPEDEDEDEKYQIRSPESALIWNFMEWRMMIDEWRMVDVASLCSFFNK